jgi:hypothetical protein
LCVLGFHLSTRDRVAVCCEVPASRFHSGFGDHTGVKGAVTDDGVVYTLLPSDDALSFVEHPSPTKVKQIAIAGNGRACCLLLGTICNLPFPFIFHLPYIYYSNRLLATSQMLAASSNSFSSKTSFTSSQPPSTPHPHPSKPLISPITRLRRA